MRRLTFLFLGLWLLLSCGVLLAQTPSYLMLLGVGNPKAAGGSGCSDSVTFLARGSFDAGHTTAYQNFICGLNTDGIGIFSSAWDILVILGTQNSTVALLNLSSTSYTPSLTGSNPAFAANAGYTGVDASSTTYIFTNYNPTTASSPNFSQNSGHASVWVNNSTVSNSGSGGGACIGVTNGSFNQTQILPKYSDGKAYFRINDNVGSGGTTNSNNNGLYLASRTSSSVSTGYFNNSVFSNPNAAGSSGVPNTTASVLATGDATGTSFGCGLQISMYSIGRGLTSTEVSNFYSRLRTFGTAVGWN